MKLSEWGELALIEEIKRRVSYSSDVLIGIGDDTAQIDVSANKSLLITTDTLSENIHFTTGLFTAYQIGYKLIASNVSDIYSMAARPCYLLLNITVPGELDKDFMLEFLDGIDRAIKQYGLQLIGGDVTSADKTMTFTATLIGIPQDRVIRRDGAQVGDGIYLSGPTGEAACGHELLKRLSMPVKVESEELPDLPLKRDSMLRVLKRFLLPDIEPIKDVHNIHSMIDVSDGLFIDLRRLCDASGVGAILYERDIPVSDAIKDVAGFLRIDPYRLITGGGEDYVLLFTAPKGLNGYYQIGEIIDEPSVRIKRIDGSIEDIGYEGYEHFVDKG